MPKTGTLSGIYSYSTIEYIFLDRLENWSTARRVRTLKKGPKDQYQSAVPACGRFVVLRLESRPVHHFDYEFLSRSNFIQNQLKQQQS